MRTNFAAAGVRVVNLVSSPGSGKTRLLTETLRRLHEMGRAVAAIVGDLETDNDAAEHVIPGTAAVCADVNVNTLSEPVDAAVGAPNVRCERAVVIVERDYSLKPANVSQRLFLIGFGLLYILTTHTRVSGNLLFNAADFFGT
ncbi:hypothetical protein EBU58_05260, partial [bacterium]|nr:hypothetical protein [bacterium]